MTQTYPAQYLPQTGFPSAGPGGFPTMTSPDPAGALAPASGMKRACAYLTDAVCISAIAGLVWLLFPSLVMVGIAVIQMAVVFSLLRARTGRTPGALITRTAAVTDGTSRAPGLKRQLIRSVLMALLHITVVGPLISILLGRGGRDWMDRVAGTASADLHKPAVSAEPAQQDAFSPQGEFAVAQTFVPGHSSTIADQPLATPAASFPQSAPSANPVAPNATPWSWTGTPQVQEPPMPSAFPAQGPWNQPDVPHVPANNGYPTAAPQAPWDQPAPQMPAAHIPAPQAPWGQPHQPVPQMPAGNNGYDMAAPQALWNQPGAPQAPVWHNTTAPPEAPPTTSTRRATPPAQPQAGPPPQAPVGGSGNPAGAGGVPASPPQPSTPPPGPAPAAAGEGAANHDDLLGARHVDQGHPVSATPGAGAVPPRSRDATPPPPENRRPSGPRRAAAQAPDVTRPHPAREPQHAAASPTPAARDEPVAWLVIDSGQRERIDAILVIGREPGNGTTEERLVAVPDPTHSLSRTHKRVGVTSTGPWVEDTFSTNGIMIRTAENTVTRLESSKRTPVPFGTTLILGERTMKIVNE